MKVEVKDFKRIDLFNYFNSKDNPFFCITTKIDITNLYNLGKKHGSCYGTIGYYIALAMNEIEEFRYRYEDNKIYLYDKINPSYTQLLKNNSIGFFACPLKDTYEEFILEYKKINNDFINGDNAFQNPNQDVVWLSCTPWFNFTGVMADYDKSTVIPQVTWDKFMFEDGKCYVNMAIFAHHSFVDGYRVGLFINKLNEFIANVKQ